MPSVTNQPLRPNYSGEIDIEALISAPLVAASKANVIMVTGQTRFLLEYCFKHKPETDTYEPVMIEMVMRKGIMDNDKDENHPDFIKIVELTFAMPLLCLVPISSLAIDKVNLDFHLEITSVSQSDAGPANKSDNIITKKDAQLNGRISYDPKKSDPNSGQNKSQLSSNLQVNINAGPLPLPVGVLAILDLYTKAIQPLPRRKIENKT